MPVQHRTEVPLAEQLGSGPPVQQCGHGRDQDRGVGLHPIGSTAQRVAGDDRLVVERVERRSGAHPTTWLVPIGFGIIWAIDAWFKWQPAFQHSFMKTIQAGAASQPSGLGPWYTFWQTILQPYAPTLAVVTALVETVIAAALILGFARKPLYLFGALWSLGIWAIPEGFGNTSRIADTDIGTSIIYVVVFAALWALDSCAGRRRYSLDALIERHLPGWARIAEVRPSGRSAQCTEGGSDAGDAR